jgi:hypothetical protein
MNKLAYLAQEKTKGKEILKNFSGIDRGWNLKVRGAAGHYHLSLGIFAFTSLQL